MRESAPKNPNRRRVLEAIQENPGICLQELVDLLGLTRTSLSHHLRALQNMRLVATVRQGRRLLVFPHSVNRPAERSVLGLMRLASARTVLMGLYNDPTMSFRKLAKQLGMTPHSVRWHVNRLSSQGLIHVLSMGRGHTVHFHPGVRASLEGMMPPQAIDVAPLTSERPATPQAAAEAPPVQGLMASGGNT